MDVITLEVKNNNVARRGEIASVLCECCMVMAYSRMSIDGDTGEWGEQGEISSHAVQWPMPLNNTTHLALSFQERAR